LLAGFDPSTHQLPSFIMSVFDRRLSAARRRSFYSPVFIRELDRIMESNGHGDLEPLRHEGFSLKEEVFRHVFLELWRLNPSRISISIFFCCVSNGQKHVVT